MIIPNRNMFEDELSDEIKIYDLKEYLRDLLYYSNQPEAKIEHYKTIKNTGSLIYSSDIRKDITKLKQNNAGQNSKILYCIMQQILDYEDFGVIDMITEYERLKKIILREESIKNIIELLNYFKETIIAKFGLEVYNLLIIKNNIVKSNEINDINFDLYCKLQLIARGIESDLTGISKQNKFKLLGNIFTFDDYVIKSLTDETKFIQNKKYLLFDIKYFATLSIILYQCPDFFLESPIILRRNQEIIDENCEKNCFIKRKERNEFIAEKKHFVKRLEFLKNNQKEIE
ncbi:MAG: hypothetical protein RSB72_00715 [Bacilli bacterium]